MTRKPSDFEFPRIPARSISDISIPDDALKPDSELGKRADDAAMELSKWALLGIAGYGFLLKEMAMPTSTGLLACQKYGLVLITGASLLAVAAACALVSKERTIHCSTLQVSILRTLKKIENGGWSEDQLASLTEDLASFRSEQKRHIVVGERCLRFAHVFLALGAVLTVICFGLVLFSLKANAGH